LSKGIAILAILAVVVSLVGGCVSINHLPVITSLEAECEVVAPLEICLIDCVAADEDGDELSYEWLTSEGAIEGDGATVAWEAPESGGIYDIVVKVSDGNGSEVTDSITVTVRVNNPPLITALTADSNWVHPSSSCQLRCDCGDADGDELMYEWSSEGGDISGEGPEVTWTAPDAMGTYAITVVVTDGLGGESSSSVSVNVGVNHPPVIDELVITPEAEKDFNPTKMKIYYGKSCDIQCIASDPDGDELSYQWSADVPPAVRDYWSAVGSISGEGSSVTWTAPSTLSEVAITVTASDDRGGTDTESIVFHVVTCYCVLNK
jgi:hypothetical protein